MSAQNKYEQIITKLVRDQGVRGRLLAVGQFSWMLFLKHLDCNSVQSSGGRSENRQILKKQFRWSNWACPKLPNGKPDESRTKNGDELLDFVNKELFPYLRKISHTQESSSTNITKSTEHGIWNAFRFLRNRISSGETLREVLTFIDAIDFSSESQLRAFSADYENCFCNMATNPGEANKYFTPRSLIRAVTNVVAPQIGETIYDGAAGTCGFLIESFNYLQSNEKQLTDQQMDFIKNETFFGRETIPSVYLFGLMNSVLHGIESPNLYRTNVLTLNNRKQGRLQKYDIVFAHLPFNQEVEDDLQKNFEIEHSAIEVLYLQHIMKSLTPNGRAAVVVPDFMLSRIENAYTQLRRKLLVKFDLHTILNLPSGMFLPYSYIQSSVLFFDRAGKTSNVWYYDSDSTCTRKDYDFIPDQFFEDFVTMYQDRPTTDHSWMVPISQFSGDFSLISTNPKNKKDIEPETIKTLNKRKQKTKSLIEETLEDTYSLLGAYLDEWFEQIKTHARIDQFVEIKAGVELPDNSELKDDYRSNYPYIRGSDVSKYGSADWSNLKFITQSTYDMIGQDAVSLFDLFICTAGNIGKTGIIWEEYHGGVLSEDLARISIKDNQKLDYRFLYLYTLTREFHKQVELATKIIDKRSKILLDRLNRIEVPVCSIEKQLELVNTIWNVKDVIDDVEYFLINNSSEPVDAFNINFRYLQKTNEPIRHILAQHKFEQLRASHSNGDSEVSFASQAQSFFIALMLTNSQAPCIPRSTVRNIKLGSKTNGTCTSHFAVNAYDLENECIRKLLCSTNHSIELTKSSSHFNKFIRNSWKNFNDSKVFSKETDMIVLVAKTVNVTDYQSLQWVLDYAKATENSKDFFRDVTISRLCSSDSRKMLEILQHHLCQANGNQEVSDEEVHEFLVHLNLLILDFDSETGPVLTLVYTLLSQFQTGSLSSDSIWTRIMEFVQSSEVSTGIIGLDDLPEDLLEVFPPGKQNSAVNPAILNNSVANSKLISKKLGAVELSHDDLHLFSDNVWEHSDRGSSEKKQETIILQKRAQIVRGIIDSTDDLDGILDLVRNVPEPKTVGETLASLNKKKFDKLILPELLTTNNGALDDFVEAYIKGRFYLAKWKWVESMRNSAWTNSQSAKFLLCLPFERDTWETAEEWLKNAENLYWKNTLVITQGSEHQEIAVEKLIKYGRPRAALDCMKRMLEDNRPIDSELCVTALLASLNSNEEYHSADANLKLNLIEYLQADSEIDQNKLFEVEWSYLSLYDYLNGKRPKTVENRLATDPEFFCNVIQLVYLPEPADQSQLDFSESNRSTVLGAHRLLKNWGELPGMDINGTFIPSKFKKWLQKVKMICSESGHLEVALNIIGNALIHAPSDSNGLWINKSIAAMLNERDISGIRYGFLSAMVSSHNGNGARTDSTTNKRRVKQLLQKADSIEKEGYFRFADSLRGVATINEDVRMH